MQANTSTAHPLRTLKHYTDQNGQHIITDLTYLYTLRPASILQPAQHVYALPDHTTLVLELRYVATGGVL